MRRNLLGGAVLCSLVLCAAAAQAAVEYTVTDLGTLGSTFAQGFGINSSGQVTGYSQLTGGAQHAFIWTPTTPNGTTGSMADLGTLGGSLSVGMDINDNSEVAGYSAPNANISYHAFLYDGAMHDLTAPNIPSSQAFGINAIGQVTGESDTNSHAFIYDGTRHDLGTLGGGNSTGYGINSAGKVTGVAGTSGGAQHAFIWTPTTPNGATGSMADIGTLGGSSSRGWKINSSGNVTGESNITGNLSSDAFLYDVTMHDLGTLGAPGSAGLDINDNGDVTGWAHTSGTIEHAFRYTSIGGMVGLNTLIAPNSGWVLSEGWGINEFGQISGFGRRTATGDTHAFLLTPVPEPTSFVLAADGTAGLLFLARSRRLSHKQRM